MSSEQKIDSLVESQRLYGFLFLLIFLFASMWASTHYVFSNAQKLEIYNQKENGLRFASASDGPYVITHLVTYGPQGEPDKATARLEPPLIIVDSAGTNLPIDKFNSLRWFDYLGRALNAPKAGTKIHALYYRPTVSEAAR